MPARVSPQVLQRTFATTTRARASISSPLSSISSTQLVPNTASVPKLGAIGRWYLPTMALIAVGMVYMPNNLFDTTPAPSPRTVTLDSANRKIGYAIANALDEHNSNQRKRELTQTEKNALLLDAYGARSTLEDIEQAFQQMERAAATDLHTRNAVLQDAYGERTSIRDVQRAMQVYEVQ